MSGLNFSRKNVTLEKMEMRENILTNIGFYCERKIVTKELVERITCQWASKDRYWDNRPTNVIEIVL